MKKIVACAALLAAVVGASNSSAASLVVNGGFENLTNGPNLGSLYTQAVGWTTSSPGGTYGGQGYGIFFGPGDGTGSPTAQDNNGPGSPPASIWAPKYGEANGFTGTSPTGGNFWAPDADTAYAPAISQQLSGLTIGKKYAVTFDWAGAQLILPGYGLFNGATTETFFVSLGGQTQQTNVIALPSHGFSGWMHTTMLFTADSVNPVLSFLSAGGPGGLPPLALLDGVSATAAVPEPATWGLMLLGFGAMGFAARRRRSNVVTA
ncbi:hypothetical protein SPAN111604_03325 [Sphingomonas antarctica]|uniref:PEPxxWA-CTERM sorting domain-containing protein n=1 Tax=Sphingomonas antarctica TaxID=2040274 RepID=UPI0039ED2952